MNKGFSLIEIIVYIGLLSILMVGIFSSVLGSLFIVMNKKSFIEEDYQILIENFHE